GRASGPVHRSDRSDRGGACRRGHRLHIRAVSVPLDEEEPHPAAPCPDEASRRARRLPARRGRGGAGLMAAHAEAHHGLPIANQSSRVSASVLGMLLFIASEVMLFGSFFTAYFFVRVVNG